MTIAFTRAAIEQINIALKQHLLGERDMSNTITVVQRILGISRDSATTIVHTEIGRAYSAAQYKKMLHDAKLLPSLKKQWLASGKKDARPGHVLCAEHTKKEPIPVAQPFALLDPHTGEVEKLRFPRDPEASASNTVNCTCMMVAVPPSAAELFARPLTREHMAMTFPGSSKRIHAVEFLRFRPSHYISLE